MLAFAGLGARRMGDGSCYLSRHLHTHIKTIPAKRNKRNKI
ncbi:hypothetical protein CVS40_9880 [Lucilia cuprina]|nr:hypothetical protein CVS40_9880 [Lucilia cuprina]